VLGGVLLADRGRDAADRGDVDAFGLGPRAELGGGDTAVDLDGGGGGLGAAELGLGVGELLLQARDLGAGGGLLGVLGAAGGVLGLVFGDEVAEPADGVEDAVGLGLDSLGGVALGGVDEDADLVGWADGAGVGAGDRGRGGVAGTWGPWARGSRRRPRGSGREGAAVGDGVAVAVDLGGEELDALVDAVGVAVLGDGVEDEVAVGAPVMVATWSRFLPAARCLSMVRRVSSVISGVFVVVVMRTPGWCCRGWLGRAGRGR
jgi:hypothetical protein